MSSGPFKILKLKNTSLQNSVSQPRVGKSEFYSDKLAHTAVVNWGYSIAPICTQEDTHARLFRRAVFDDVMSQNELTTQESWKLST